MKKVLLSVLYISFTSVLFSLVYTSIDVPISIAQTNHLYESDLTVSDPGIITDINCTIQVEHYWDEDLNIYLVHNGTSVELTTHNGSSGDHYWNTVFDDEAQTPIQGQMAEGAPFTGSYQPEGILAHFDGQEMSGIWTLQITDDMANDFGILHNWSIEVMTIAGEPNLIVSPLNTYFDEIPVEECSNLQTFNMSNSGSAHVDISNILIIGSDYDEFILYNNPAPCSIPPNTTFDVQFCPTSSGFKEAWVQISFLREVIYIPLTGYGWEMPLNENCNLAQPITVVDNQYFTTTGTTTSGTAYPHFINQDIWFVYTAETDGLLEVDLCGSFFDTRLAIYEDCENINELVYNDDSQFCGEESLHSTVSLPVESGEDYFIQVGGAEEESGVGNITINHRGFGTLEGTVILANGNGVPEDAVIYFGTESISPDQAGFFSASLYEGIYNISAELAGYDPELQSEIIIEVGDTTFVDFIMDEYWDIHLPVRNLLAEYEPEDDEVMLSWTAPAMIEEYCESTFPALGWLKFNPDGGTGWETLSTGTTPLPGWETGEADSCPDGGNTQAFVSNITGGNTGNDQWLITPQIKVHDDDTLEFWMKYYFSEFTDNVDIRISDTVQNDITAFDIVMDEFNFDTNFTTEWTQYSYNLSHHVPIDSEIYIAFREYVPDNQISGSAVSLDNILVEYEDNQNRAELLEYEIYIDGILDGVTEGLTYEITGLIQPVLNEIGVVAVYDTGESDMITVDEITDSDNNMEPLTTTLGANFPNPFNPNTTISFSISAEEAKNAKIEIYNIKGQKVKEFSDIGHQTSVIWNAEKFSSGIYFYKLTIGDFSNTKKMLLLK